MNIALALQLIILIPYGIYVFLQDWQQIEIDNLSKRYNRIAKMLTYFSSSIIAMIAVLVVINVSGLWIDMGATAITVLIVGAILCVREYAQKYQVKNDLNKVLIHDGSYLKNRTYQVSFIPCKNRSNKIRQIIKAICIGR